MRVHLKMGVATVEEDMVHAAAMAVTNMALVPRNRRLEARDMERVVMEVWGQRQTLQMIIEMRCLAGRRRGCRSRPTRIWAMANRPHMKKGSLEVNPEVNPEVMGKAQAMKRMEIGN